MTLTTEQLRDMKRNRRKHDVRKKTECVRSLPKLVRLNRGLPTDHERPKTRGECLEQERPCPFVGCRHHLYLDVGSTGSIVFRFPDKDPDEIPVSCSLDVADDGPATLEEVADVTNLTRERVRQIEVVTTAHFKEALKVSA